MSPSNPIRRHGERGHWPMRLLVGPMLAVLVPAVLASTTASSAEDWPARAGADIAAIDTWVREVYPRMVDPDEPGFAAQWADAVATAQTRAADIVDDNGWRLVLRTLVRSARDGHVGLQLDAGTQPLRWAGLALERRGSRWLVRQPAGSPAGSDARIADGAELLSCDGEPAAQALRRRLDLFATDWSVGAQQAMHGWRLFVDIGNPWAPAPRQCRFEHAGEITTIDLRWTAVDAESVSAAVEPFRRLHSQGDRVDLAYAEDGAGWLTIGNLSDHAALTRLRAEVAAQRQRLLDAPYLVWDLRGNGGGDASLLSDLARVLWGEHLAIDPPTAMPKRWRASATILAEVERLRAANLDAATGNPNLVAAADALIAPMRQALAAGVDLIVDPGAIPASIDSSPRAGVDSEPGKLPARQPVYVLTDGGCFSSCVDSLVALRRLGAIQVGDASGRQTKYGEVWFQRALPSGRGSMMLPIAIHPVGDDALGGNEPDLPWLGAAEDAAGLRALIAADAQRRRNARSSQ